MRRIDCGLAGGKEACSSVGWDELELAEPWRAVALLLAGGHPTRPVQAKAFGELRILETRRNLIVSAPTNSGKSLVGTLVLLDAVQRGRRALLLEPLRAVAREKGDELESLSPALRELLKVPFAVKVTTGDYRLDHESFAAAPSESGELVIATPERFEAILRNPQYDSWIRSFGAVCVDEAHLISSPRRGPVLEYVVTALLGLEAPPRLVLLSASVGDSSRARDWLAPCDVVSVTDRVPGLHREVWETEGEEDHKTAIAAFAREALSADDGTVLVFVYQTRSAVTLAGALGTVLGQLAGPLGPLAYHAQMPLAERERVRAALIAGATRVVVTTTALALGVNLPATHVLVRDCYFPGSGSLSTSELLQMMGRAGRGSRNGRAVVLMPRISPRSADDLALAIKEERLPALASSFDRRIVSRRRKFEREEVDPITQAVGVVAALLARSGKDGLLVSSVQGVLARSLGGTQIAALVPGCVDWLTDPSRMLAHRSENARIALTALGLNAVQATLPLTAAAGVGQLLRDLLTVDPHESFLRHWKPLDTLLLVELLSERPRTLRPFSQHLAEQVDGWMEGHSTQVPLLYRNWVSGREGFSKAEEVVGSLGIKLPPGDRDRAEAARRSCYLAALRAVVLTERSHGTSIPELERRWGIANLEGIEERWRDEDLWLISGLTAILEVRCFLYHLRHGCEASIERVRRVSQLLRSIRLEALQLRERLMYCSPLGALWTDLRRSTEAAARPEGRRMGTASLRRLERAGVTSVEALSRMTIEELIGAGLPRRWAEQVVTHVRKRAS